MSEDFIRNVARAVGPYMYYNLGSTTLAQLKRLRIIPPKDYRGVSNKKPDSLLTYQSEVMAVIEHKAPDELAKPSIFEHEIEEKSPAARALCNLLIITDDTDKTYWINPYSGQEIEDENGQVIHTLVDAKTFANISELELLIQKIHGSITPTNSRISKKLAIDPTPLAQRLWQSIWVATGKSPIKCLYNVVELFIFKFLSDLNILPEDQGFTSIYNKAQGDPMEALRFYAANTRKQIYNLFPKGGDGTTIINGTIFVNEQGEANLSQATLFKRSLDHLKAYEQDFGPFTEIDQQFKTRLYETFLRQEVEALGQYFTPRTVVRSVARMAGIDRVDFDFAGKRICDPFCGVGGFLLELLNLNSAMRETFRPDHRGIISPAVTLHGFDKGFERDDERTIILAKANMLIYLAELLFQNPAASRGFATAFNSVFHLFKNNLGTFGRILSDDEKYDMILSNPPYVTSGTSIIKEEIAANEDLREFYQVNGLGLESLSIEWIVKSLRPGGTAYIIVPDGILGRVGAKKLRDFVLDKCYLDAIISLPPRTFFSNSESTYILALTKKRQRGEKQTKPVFAFLVSSIGERLTSVRRETIPENDLPEMERLFSLYKASSGPIDTNIFMPYKRCKLLSLDELADHWVIDRKWSKAEKIALGIIPPIRQISKEALDHAFDNLRQASETYASAKTHSFQFDSYHEVTLGDESIFELSIGKRVLRAQLVQSSRETVPVYSSNVRAPFGRIVEPRSVHDVSRPSILWGIDGNFDFNLIPARLCFDITDHTGRIQVRPEVDIDPSFLVHALRRRINEEEFDRSFRASLTNMRQFTVRIPTTADGEFDLETQREIAKRLELLEQLRIDVVEAKSEYDRLFKYFVTDLEVIDDEEENE